MRYVTIWNTTEQSKVLISRNILEQNGIDYRVLDEQMTANFPIGTRIQVAEDQEEKARAALRQSGLLYDPATVRVPEKSFWIWLFVALLVIIVASILINQYMSWSMFNVWRISSQSKKNPQKEDFFKSLRAKD